MSKPKSNILYLVFLSIALSSSTVASQYGYSQTTAATTTIAYASANPISILSSSSFRDDIGAYHIVGEVENNSPADSMKYVKIVATLYDKAKNVVGSDFTFSDVAVLRPAEKSPFKIILTDIRQSQKVSNYKLSTSGDKTEAIPPSLKLSVDNSHLHDIGAYHIVGEVTNQGSQKATFVKVSAAFYNRSKVVVAADFTYTDPKDLQPGQIAPFEIVVTSVPTTSNEITFASLNVNSEQYSSIRQNQTCR
jgi:hypothetical protein